MYKMYNFDLTEYYIHTSTDSEHIRGLALQQQGNFKMDVAIIISIYDTTIFLSLKLCSMEKSIETNIALWNERNLRFEEKHTTIAAISLISLLMYSRTWNVM